MEPVFGFALFFLASLLVWVVASKRGRKGWALFLLSIVGGAVLVPVIARAGGTGVAAGFGAFIAPAAVLFYVLASKTGSDIALQKGSYGAFKKCPFCAESVRVEAVKCKHCGSAI